MSRGVAKTEDEAEVVKTFTGPEYSDVLVPPAPFTPPAKGG